MTSLILIHIYHAGLIGLVLVALHIGGKNHV